MENFKGTKGNWEIDGNSIFPKGKGYSIAIISEISPVNSKLKPKEEALANAKLIASAPELLVALKNLLYEYDQEMRFKGKLTHSDVEMKAINAIKKATD